MAFPQEFINMLSGILPEGERAALISALQTEPQVSIRTNLRVPGAVDMALESLECKSDGNVPWASNAVYLDHRPQFTMDPLLHCGTYYVQEASSMFLERAVRKCVKGPVRALDLCAAPGGKSTLLASVLPEGSLLVSNEIQRSRAQILAENMTKWGSSNVVVTCNTPAQIGASSMVFDLIAVDAPCSGEGMFRKDAQAVSDWSTENVAMCASRQRQILEDIWPALAPGGFLIYSTCTFNRHEDEDNVVWMTERFGAEPVAVETLREWNICGSLTEADIPVYHFMQHRTRGEGFFLALLRKPGDCIPQRSRICKSNVQFGQDWLDGAYTYYQKGDMIHALPESLAWDMMTLGRELYTLVCGIGLARLKGRDWIPAHGLAMSRDLKSDAFCRVELSRQQALAYLHCEAIQLNDAPRGMVLLTYRNRPLGFVKNLGNRANNMYPSEWRIRTALPQLPNRP